MEFVVSTSKILCYDYDCSAHCSSILPSTAMLHSNRSPILFLTRLVLHPLSESFPHNILGQHFGLQVPLLLLDQSDPHQRPSFLHTLKSLDLLVVSWFFSAKVSIRWVRRRRLSFLLVGWTCNILWFILLIMVPSTCIT